MIKTKDSPQKALQIFQMLAETFKEHDISPTPLNYYVLYEYLKGNIPQLRQELDAALNNPFGYNDRLGKRLYDTYLVDGDSSNSEFDRAFKRLIDVMVKKMNLWSDRLETHTEELDKCTEQLSDPDLNSDEIKRITNSVINTASSMKASSQAFQEEMLNSTDAIHELKRQLIEARTEAMTDELTEIGNRKAFNLALSELMLDAEDNPGSLCLMLSDIDHFKLFNDTYGHLVGDSVLRYYASIMKKSKKDNETICRYGGEEFAVIFADSSLDEATVRSEEIRHAIETAQLKRKNSSEPLRTITASFGIATFKGSSETEKELIERADKALYLAKNQGRNQVVNENELAESLKKAK
ncbi:MAG: diguanylate cyclase [Thiomicrorhabdus sp.]|nr:MAG: diguanylate cyclase [Thiomicrorhabdus sp.]